MIVLLYTSASCLQGHSLGWALVAAGVQPPFSLAEQGAQNQKQSEIRLACFLLPTWRLRKKCQFLLPRRARLGFSKGGFTLSPSACFHLFAGEEGLN